MTEPAEDLLQDDDGELPKLRPPEQQHAAGELELPDGVQVLEGSPDGGRRSVAVVVAKFNGELTGRLLASALGELERGEHASALIERYAIGVARNRRGEPPLLLHLG